MILASKMASQMKYGVLGRAEQTVLESWHDKFAVRNITPAKQIAFISGAAA